MPYIEVFRVRILPPIVEGAGNARLNPGVVYEVELKDGKYVPLKWPNNGLPKSVVEADIKLLEGEDRIVLTETDPRA